MRTLTGVQNDETYDRKNEGTHEDKNDENNVKTTDVTLGSRRNDKRWKTDATKTATSPSAAGVVGLTQGTEG